MTIFQSIIYGIVQGLTEFLPISSTAHLTLLPWAAGWPDPGLSFDVALHLGTLVALLLYFRKEWIELIGSAIGILQGRTKTPDARLVMFIVGATIPGAIAGVLFEHKVEDAMRAPQVIALMLIALALVLAVAEMIGRRKKSLDEISWGDAITVGVAQALAIIPGVSRSGVTITASLLRNMKRDAAARFSFFLSTPLIGGAVGKRALVMLKTGTTVEQMVPFVVGILVSAIVGYLAIAFMLRYLQTRTTYPFVYYRLALGIAVFLAIWTGIR
jgi:undecaprenyl-diphosphatase